MWLGVVISEIDAPFVEIPFLPEFRIGNVYAMVVFGLDFENLEYGYRMDGPNVPWQGHRFDSSKILLDPYAKAIGGRDIWGQQPDWNDSYQHRGRLVYDDFDWESDRRYLLFTAVQKARVSGWSGARSRLAA